MKGYGVQTSFLNEITCFKKDVRTSYPEYNLELGIDTNGIYAELIKAIRLQKPDAR